MCPACTSTVADEVVQDRDRMLYIMIGNNPSSDLSSSPSTDTTLRRRPGAALAMMCSTELFIFGHQAPFHSCCIALTSCNRWRAYRTW